MKKSLRPGKERKVGRKIFSEGSARVKTFQAMRRRTRTAEGCEVQSVRVQSRAVNAGARNISGESKRGAPRLWNQAGFSTTTAKHQRISSESRQSRGAKNGPVGLEKLRVLARMYIHVYNLRMQQTRKTSQLMRSLCCLRVPSKDIIYNHSICSLVKRKLCKKKLAFKTYAIIHYSYKNLFFRGGVVITMGR
jgi:hypothetical protein